MSGLSWLYGRHRVEFHHAKQTVYLPTKDGDQVLLSDMCKAATPPCQLNPLLFNGHLQTIWTSMKGIDVPVYYRRHVFEAEDPRFAGSFAVDFVAKESTTTDPGLPPRTSYYTDEEFKGLGSDDSKPMLVTLHGLSGGSYELYLRQVLAPLFDSKEWEACVVNSRGCANSAITSGILYNARSTWDVRQTVNWLKKIYPNRPLFGIGFSLGANILTNYVAEEGENCQLEAAVVVSSPWNLETSFVELHRTFVGREIYSATMGGNMKKLFQKHSDVICEKTNINLKDVEKVKYLFEFDREVQCKVWGYPTFGAYYRDASSVDAVLGIRIPFFVINARDDPIAADSAIPWDEIKANPCVVLCATSGGGHLGWFEVGGGRWFARPAVNFLTEMAKTVDLKMKKIEHKVQQEALAAAINKNYTSSKSPFAIDPVRRITYLPEAGIEKKREGESNGQ